MKIELLEPDKMSREKWKKYHEFRRIRHLETTPDDPYLPDEIVEKAILNDYRNELMYQKRYCIYDDSESKQIGSIFVQTFSEKDPSYESNKHLALFDISILKNYRKKGIATQSLKNIIDFAKEHSLTVAISQTYEDDGREFLKRIGAKAAYAAKENRLQMNEVDWNMVKDWISEAESLNPDTKIVKFTQVPGDIIEKYCQIYTETANQAPLDDLDLKNMVFSPEVMRKREEDFKKIGFTNYTMITLEPDGDISGLTEILRMPDKKTMLSQNLTGVRDKYRDRKLGKWLKALMLLDMKERFPEVTVVTTGNADSNAPMLSINHRLGFKAYRESTAFQINVQDLETYLASKHEKMITY